MFTGRDKLLDCVHRTLEDGEHSQPVALYGMAGVGKTLLAVEYAHRYANHYDLVWWFNAEKLPDLKQQFTNLAIELHLELDRIRPDPVATVRRYLRSHPRWLLIFDNADDAAGLRRFLPDPSGHVLITSRGPLWAEVAREHEVDVFTGANPSASCGGIPGSG